MGKRVASTTITPQYLSTSQEDVLHLWPLVTLRKSKNGTVKVVQKTSDETPIVPQRLRNHCTSKNNVARQKVERKLASQLRSERTKCSYSLRTWAFSTYMDTDLLYSDDVTYCKQCQKHFFGVCSLHFKLVFNREIVRDGSVVERARLTAPWPLFVAESMIPGAGEGVWTSAALPRGLVFGPYEGQILRLKRNSKAADSGYAWHLKSHKKSRVYVDSVNKSISNWLRYVNCARDSMEMNLEAFQYKKDVYYITLREIESNSELLVWYGDEYGRDLGILNLSNNILSMPAAQEEPAELLRREETELKNTMGSSKITTLYNEQTQYKKGKVQLSKPQSAVQHLFCPARLERKEDHSVRVVYINSTDNNHGEERSEGAVRKYIISRDEPRSIPSVRFNQKYNCKYNHAYCVKCKKTYSSLCPKHPMTLILDKPVPRDGSVQNRAELTAPWPLYIAESSVEDAGQGIWTSANLPQGLVFGPCEGRIIKKTGSVSGYAWEIRGRPDLEIDAEETSVSNWVRYINCARNYIERNLIAMQIQNEIFYVTNTEIKRGTELMVWYGAAYGNWLGISTRDFFKPRLKEAELERWCSDCQVLFTSPEFLSRHQERCRQSTRGKSKKRTLQDSNLFPHKHLKTEEKPQVKDREKTTLKNLGEKLLLEARDAVTQTKDLIDMSDAVVDCFGSSDYTKTPSFIKPPFSVGNSTKNSENDISQRLHYKPRCRSGSGNRTFSSGKAHMSVKCQTKPHSKSSASKTGLEKVVSDFHKWPSDFISLDKSLDHDTESSMCFGHKSGEPYPNALGSHGIPKETTNSIQTPNLSPVIPHDSHKPSTKFPEFDSTETINNVSLDSSSAQLLDSFLNHDEPFLDSLNVEDCYSSESTAYCHKSHFSDTASEGNANDHSSDYSSNIPISYTINCDNQSSNIDSSLSSSGLRYSSHKSGHRPQKPCRENTAIEKLCHKEESAKLGQIYNISDSKYCPGTHKNCHSIQSNERERKCLCFAGTKVNKQNRDDTCQQMLKCPSTSSNCCRHHSDGMLQRTLKKKDLTNASLQLYWKTRQVINCQWQLSNHSSVERRRIYIEKKRLRGGEMANKMKATVQPQKATLPQVKEYIQDGIYNASQSFGQRERTMGISCDKFYAHAMNHKMSYQNMVKMSGNCSRQTGQCGISDHGQQDNLSSLLQNDQIFYGEDCNTNKNDHSLISGSRQINIQRKEDSCARTQPLQSLNKKHEHLYSNLCSRNGNGTLYECFKCGRKFASRYNLHEHQYFCM